MLSRPAQSPYSTVAMIRPSAMTSGVSCGVANVAGPLAALGWRIKQVADGCGDEHSVTWYISRRQFSSTSVPGLHAVSGPPTRVRFDQLDFVALPISPRHIPVRVVHSAPSQSIVGSPSPSAVPATVHAALEWIAGHEGTGGAPDGVVHVHRLCLLMMSVVTQV